jgi:hypothetical protein
MTEIGARLKVKGSRLKADGARLKPESETPGGTSHV